MNGHQAPSAQSAAAAMVVRCGQVLAFSEDLAQDAAIDERKGEPFCELVNSLGETARALGHELASESALGIGATRVSRTKARKVAGAAAKDLRMLLATEPELGPFELVEFVVSTDWPRRVSWAVPRFDALAIAADRMGWDVDAAAVREIAGDHKRALKRLRRDIVAPGVQMSFGALMLAVTAATAGSGPLAQAVGTQIGQQMGLSGAAATSAGLAWLGGGSLAAGGFGMAGGAFLINTATKATEAGVKFAVRRLAMSSPPELMSELAKLDVVCQLDYEQRKPTIAGLRTLHAQLEEQWDEIRPGRRDRIQTVVRGAGKLLSPLQGAREVLDALPDKEERNVARSTRAVEYELRHLTSPAWKRRVHGVARLSGFPAASRPLDHL